MYIDDIVTDTSNRDKRKKITTTIPTKFPVLVTGANGYLGGVLIRELLAAGLTVHGTVQNLAEAKAAKKKRDAANKIPIKPKTPEEEEAAKLKKEPPKPVKTKEEEYPHLYALDGATERLHLFEAGLVKAGAFADAMEGCRVVFHTASPHILPETPITKETYKEVVAPAIKGTKNVFNQAKKTPSVKRIVMTSSYMAMMSDAKDLMEREKDENDADDDVTVDESFWNESASLTYQPYAYGKTEAEKDAWLKFEKQDQWDLITLCPGIMMGPGLFCMRPHPNTKLLTDMTDGTMKRGVPPLPLAACVDVRDVARAHIEAAFRPTANGRYLLCPHLETSYWSWIELLRNRYPEYAGSMAMTPNSKAWCLVKGGMARKYVARQMGTNRILINSTRSERELGISYRPWEESICDMMDQIIDDGLLDPEHMAEEARLAKEEEERIIEEKKEAKAKRKEARLKREAEEKEQAKEERKLEKEQRRLEKEAQREEKRKEREAKKNGTEPGEENDDQGIRDGRRRRQHQEQAMSDDALV